MICALLCLFFHLRSSFSENLHPRKTQTFPVQFGENVKNLRDEVKDLLLGVLLD